MANAKLDDECIALKVRVGVLEELVKRVSDKVDEILVKVCVMERTANGRAVFVEPQAINPMSYMPSDSYLEDEDSKKEEAGSPSRTIIKRKYTEEISPSPTKVEESSSNQASWDLALGDTQ